MTAAVVPHRRTSDLSVGEFRRLAEQRGVDGADRVAVVVEHILALTDELRQLLEETRTPYRCPACALDTKHRGAAKRRLRVVRSAC